MSHRTRNRRRRSNRAGRYSPPVTSTRTVETVVYVVLVALALLLAFDNWRTGMGWEAEGPQAGYFPFYLSVVLVAASLYGLVGIFVSARHQAEPSLRATSFAA